MYYLLGYLEKDTSSFNKNIPHEKWQMILSKQQVEKSFKTLRYFTIDKCYSKIGDRFYVEDIHDYSLVNDNILMINNKRQPIDLFPLKLKYNNKQVCYTRVAKNGLIFTEYSEGGKKFYEITGQDSQSLESLV